MLSNESQSLSSSGAVSRRAFTSFTFSFFSASFFGRGLAAALDSVFLEAPTYGRLVVAQSTKSFSVHSSCHCWQNREQNSLSANCAAKATSSETTDVSTETFTPPTVERTVSLAVLANRSAPVIAATTGISKSASWLCATAHARADDRPAPRTASTARFAPL